MNILFLTSGNRESIPEVFIFQISRRISIMILRGISVDWSRLIQPYNYSPSSGVRFYRNGLFSSPIPGMRWKCCQNISLLHQWGLHGSGKGHCFRKSWYFLSSFSFPYHAKQLHSVLTSILCITQRSLKRVKGKKYITQFLGQTIKINHFGSQMKNHRFLYR